MPAQKPFRIAIARAGSFTDSQGRPHSFGQSDLDAIVSTYNPAKLEAPLVFGHPQDNAPAFGWVQSLQREGATLFAYLAQVPDTVRQLVHDGRYRYVSMSLMPDKKRLRHVGLLGAEVPAIEGLGPVEFTTSDSFITINFSTGEDSMTVEELQQQVGALTEQVNALKTELAKLKDERTGAENAKTEAENRATASAAEFAAYKNGITLKTREARLDALVKAGKVKPAERGSCLSFAAALSNVETPVEFAAADGKTETIPAEERYFRELETRPACGLNVDFAAFATPEHAQQKSGPAFTPSDVTAKL